MATNGRPPYQWSIASGNLPQGLSLNASGVISGTPTVFGQFGFVVRVTDSIGAPAIASFTMNVLPDVEPLRVVSSGPQAEGLTGINYFNQLFYAGGRAPVTWGLAPGSSLPPGLTLSPTEGKITGRPRQAGTFTFIARVVDAESTQALSGTLTIVIDVGPLGVVDFGTLPLARTGVDYSFSPLGTGGTPPYTWSIESGNLAPGLTLNASTGRISGRPTAVGLDFSFTLRITDSTSAFALSDSFKLVVEAGPLTITSSGTLAPGNVNVDYSQQLQLNGGKNPYTWSLLTGALPAGLTLNAAGLISGKPTAVGTLNFTVRVVDAATAQATSGQLTIVISP
jgi:hypothetical protein